MENGVQRVLVSVVLLPSKKLKEGTRLRRAGRSYSRTKYKMKLFDWTTYILTPDYYNNAFSTTVKPAQLYVVRGRVPHRPLCLPIGP